MGEMVEFSSNGGRTDGYLSIPKQDSGPGVVVIQEWWGLDDWIKEQTDRLAGLGYVALAVDLYRGKVTGDPDVAHQLMRGLPEDQALADLRGSLLGARPGQLAPHEGEQAFQQHKILASEIHRAALLDKQGVETEREAWVRYIRTYFPVRKRTRRMRGVSPGASRIRSSSTMIRFPSRSTIGRSFARYSGTIGMFSRWT